MKRVQVSVMLLLTVLVLTSCVPAPAGGFSVYLLADDGPATELLQVDLQDLQLQEEPILSADDVIAYSWESHDIELTPEAFGRIRQLFAKPLEVRGIPFVVSVDTDRIYAGAFWTPASSTSFDGVVIPQPLDPQQHAVGIELGYPSPEAFTGRDPRSDQRILRSLEARGKLR